MELDGEVVPIRPFSTILIKPLCRHRAVGRLRIVNICIPPFDPADEADVFCGLCHCIDGAGAV